MGTASHVETYHSNDERRQPHAPERRLRDERLVSRSGRGGVAGSRTPRVAVEPPSRPVPAAEARRRATRTRRYGRTSASARTPLTAATIPSAVCSASPRESAIVRQWDAPSKSESSSGRGLGDGALTDRPQDRSRDRCYYGYTHTSLIRFARPGTVWWTNHADSPSVRRVDGRTRPGSSPTAA